jgi:hypothetical protein
MSAKNCSIKKWTVGIVNFNSSVYLKYIVKSLYDFNDPRQFNLIIVDNSKLHERDELQQIVACYRYYDNIEVIYHVPMAHFPSGQHGEALNIILEKSNTPFLMVQDPDFFWVQKNHLTTLERYFSQGYLAIGAPYRTRNIKDGNKNFPAAFGCAYKKEALSGVDFSPSNSLSEISELGRDVGWKIRETLSSGRFLSFEQSKSDIHLGLGKFSYDVNPYEYYLEGRKVAYHLFKGSRGNVVPKNPLKGYDGTSVNGYSSEDMVNIELIREKYGIFFYNEAASFNPNSFVFFNKGCSKFVGFVAKVILRICSKILLIFGRCFKIKTSKRSVN